MHRSRSRAKVVLIVVVAVLGMILGVTGVGVPSSHASTSSPQPWLAPGLSTEQRVDMLLSAMTLQDKLAELSAGNCSPYESCLPANARLGLPEMVLEDDSTGVAAGMTGVTALPATVAASASFDPSLINRYGQVIGREEKAKGVNVALAPTVNILRNPQWGRSFESLGEDPYLSSQMGVADMQGIQSQGVVSNLKHFVVYNQETNRHTVSAQVSSRTLHEIYLPAFAAAVKADVGSIMASYNSVNGVPSSQNPYLLTTVLRDQLGFKGFVRSDGGGTYSTVPAANSGLDIQVKGVDYFGPALAAAVEDGQVSMARINSMVRPILRDMFHFNLVGKPWGNGTKTENVITAADTQTALTSAEQGTVLLRNQNAVLPLSSSTKSIAVLGPYASPGLAEGGGSGYVTPPFVISPVQGIQKADPAASVSYSAGLPAPASLPSIPNQYLSRPYKAGASYTATLTPPVSGRYTLTVEDPKGYSPMTMSVDGKPVLTAAGTTGDSYGSGSVDLVAGQPYQLQITGSNSRLAWATPAARSAAIAQAVSAAKASQVAVVVVGDHESEATDRVRIGLSAGQNQLIEQVAAANPNTIVVLNTGAPVLMPWINQVAGVLEAWYPGEQDGAALAAVLFGQVNPSAKLPMTFPASASQIPASTPAQFPGVNGVADYSEGLLVGYRWYDAKGLTPLFPFGYGLSYTTFGFSHLAVSPASTTSLGTVQVGATVTNTGTRPGAEVAQLYIGDPAITGEPPIQLKGFQKVTLSPGQSTRVHFTVNSQDLSYWSSSAHTWTVADGAYKILVGDSSANLPLASTLTVGATTGKRALTMNAPGTIKAGQPFTVTAALSPGGDLALNDVQLNLSAPPGWNITPSAPNRAASMGSSQALNGSWQVTAPAGAQDDIRTLAATASFHSAAPSTPSPGGNAGTTTARTQVTVQPLVTTTITPSSLDLAAGRSAHVTVSYQDTSGYPASISWNAAPPPGSGITVEPASGSAQLAPDQTATVSELVTTSTPQPQLNVPIAVQVTADGTTAPAPGAYLQVTVPYSSLSAAYDNVGITSSSAPSAGDFSGTGITYAAGALSNAGLSPGASVAKDGITFTWPDAPAGQPDNVVADGQTFAISGTGAALGFLGASDYGNSSGTGVITYTDGTTQPFTLTMSDYYKTTPASGDQVLVICPYRHQASGISNHTAALYFTSIPLTTGKTVADVTLPKISAGVAKGQTAMHIFSAAIGG